jgi:hypothetical protein
MAFAVIATANHFVIDVAAGVALEVIALSLQRASLFQLARPPRITRAHWAPSAHGHN